MKRSIAAFLACSLGLSVVNSLAEDFGERTPSTTEYIEALTPSLQSKGLVPAVRRPSASMRIQFGLNSSKIRQDSVQSLSNLAVALADDRLKASSFTVTGHTDTTGSESLNMRLSEQRARAVVDFLIERGIESSRLVALGKGSTELLPRADPESAVNRRVEIALRPN